MNQLPLQLEGTWEEILAQSDKLEGQQVRVIILHDNPKQTKRLSDFQGSLPATRPYLGTQATRIKVAQSLDQKVN
jgi:hypothetical protein